MRGPRIAGQRGRECLYRVRLRKLAVLQRPNYAALEKSHVAGWASLSSFGTGRVLITN
jgi:hypothetical protein